MSELFNAVISNDLFNLQDVLFENPELDVDQAIIGNLTALHVAAEKGYSSCAKVLLAAGADVNAKDEHDTTPLITAIVAGYPLTAVALLQRPTCAVNSTTDTGMTALHFAARLGSAGIVQLLLQGGADPTITDSSGESALTLALHHRCTEVVKTLVLGFVFVDVNIFSKSETVLFPLYASLKDDKILIAAVLLLGGYRGIHEVDKYLNESLSADDPGSSAIAYQRLSKLQKELLYQQSYYKSSAPLHHLCRLKVRQCLCRNIKAKVNQLVLPQQLKDYICFKDIWSPPELQTTHEIYCFFNDNAREVYELV